MLLATSHSYKVQGKNLQKWEKPMLEEDARKIQYRNLIQNTELINQHRRLQLLEEQGEIQEKSTWLEKIVILG